MTRDIEDVFCSFFDKVEEDDDFFSYYGVSDEEAMRLAKERAQSYLREAMIYLRRQVELDFNLALVEDSDTYVFAEEITDMEVDILSEIMLMRYLERGYAKLKPKINVLSSTDLKVLHSPANERNSYVAMIDKVREHVRSLVSYYAIADRHSGKRKLMSSFGTFDTEET
ncbi:MAG: hypothetical protein J6S14_20800 [Clostridia bacterium]|nr:hypothetical protein [Clostridia bacterium]